MPSSASVFSSPHAARLLTLSAVLVTLYQTPLPAQTPPTFESPVVYPVGSGPTNIRAAEFNSDGILDLVVTNGALGGEGSISVLLGQGDGTFGDRTDYRSGIQPGGLAVGDVTGDGRLDLIVLNGPPNAISIYRGLSPGRFAYGSDLRVGEAPFGVAVGDLDRDGSLDFAVSNFRSNTVSVFLAEGHGKFQSPAMYPTRDGPYSIAIADLNGDGTPDLLVGSLPTVWSVYASPISAFLGRGDGTFGPRTDVYVGRDPEDIATADFNEDGKPDVVTVNAESRTVTVLLGDGLGSFSARSDYQTGDLPLGVTVADFNRDGHLDLAVANHQGNTISVLVGKGDGSFATRVDYAAGGASHNDPTRVAAADFNGDGWSDVAVTNISSNTVAVLLNLGAGGMAATRSARQAIGQAIPNPRIEKRLTVSPNPVRSGVTATISYVIPEPGATTRIAIYAASGGRVREFAPSYQVAGIRTALWNGLDGAGRRLPAGAYFVRVSIGQVTSTTRVLLIP